MDFGLLVAGAFVITGFTDILAQNLDDIRSYHLPLP